MEISPDLPYARVFEEYADKYDQWFSDNQDVYLEELKRIREAIGDIPSPALEIGVGSGRFAKPLGIGYGVEPSWSLGLMAKERGIEVIRAIGEAVPVKSSVFRMVAMITVLCFLKKPEETLHEFTGYSCMMEYLLLHLLRKVELLLSDTCPVQIRGDFSHMPGFMIMMR